MGSVHGGRGRVLREESGEGPLGGSRGAWGGGEGRGAGARASVPTPWAWSEREAFEGHRQVGLRWQSPALGVLCVKTHFKEMEINVPL